MMFILSWFCLIWLDDYFISKTLICSSLQDDIPSNSLKFHYGPHDNSAERGGYVSVSLTPSIMTVTYYDESGEH